MEDTHSITSVEEQRPKGIVIAEELLAQCHQLLSELEEFHAFLTQRRKEQMVDIRQFHNSVRSELKSLERLSSADPTAERTVHTLRSSNLQFYTAVWDAAKASAGLVTFSKRFYWATTPPTRSSKRAGRPGKQCALVDIVAQGGLEWVKVSTVTETRLLFEQAKAGWEDAASSSDDDNSSSDDEDGAAANNSPPPSSSPSSSPSPSDNPIELIRLATDLQTASHATQIRYRHPQIRIVLPKIPTTPSPQTLIILNSLIATGATLQVGPSLSPFPHGLPPSPRDNATPTLSAIFPKLLPNPNASLTPTLNVDCTILLALISDLSHSPQTPHSPSHHRAITRQIELEARDHLLPEYLYPALEGRDLVCTAEAATRMREIVEQIGTTSERARAELLLDDDQDDETPSPTASRLSLFASHSEYAVPPTLRLPIHITTATVPDLLRQLPPVAHTIAEQLSAINRSVFLYGWARGISTVSSNRAVAKVVEDIIADKGEGKVIGPEVWLCATARSLVGKERQRKG
ncbi:hypothetical protein MMC22_006316 [Lobaria immixta]|nr:hypothetical protein [Lobaria immixta]